MKVETHKAGKVTDPDFWEKRMAQKRMLTEI